MVSVIVSVRQYDEHDNLIWTGEDEFCAVSHRAALEAAYLQYPVEGDYLISRVRHMMNAPALV